MDTSEHRERAGGLLMNGGLMDEKVDSWIRLWVCGWWLNEDMEDRDGCWSGTSARNEWS